MTNYLYDELSSIEGIDNAGNELVAYTQGTGIDQPVANLRSGATSCLRQSNRVHGNLSLLKAVLT